MILISRMLLKGFYVAHYKILILKYIFKIKLYRLDLSEVYKFLNKIILLNK